MKLITFYPEISLESHEKLNKFYEWEVDTETQLLVRDALFLDDKESSLSSLDREFLDQIYDKNLSKVTSSLNKIHKLNYSLQNWEILIGPWLRITIFAFYDRWLHIEDLSKHDDFTILTQKFSIDGLIPEDFDDFHEIFYHDKWNAHIYTIIAELFEIRVKEKGQNVKKYAKEQNPKSAYKISNLINFTRNLFYLLLYKCMNIFNPLRREISLYNTTSYKDISLFLFMQGKGFPLVVNNFKNKTVLESNSIYYFTRLRPLAMIRRNSSHHIEYGEFIFDNTAEMITAQKCDIWSAPVPLF